MHQQVQGIAAAGRVGWDERHDGSQQAVIVQTLRCQRAGKQGGVLRSHRFQADGVVAIIAAVAVAVAVARMRLREIYQHRLTLPRLWRQHWRGGRWFWDSGRRGGGRCRQFSGGGSGGSLNTLVSGGTQDEAVHVAVTDVIPHPTGRQLHGKGVAGGGKVVQRVCAAVAAAPHVAARQARPQVVTVVARLAHGGCGTRLAAKAVAADGASVILPAAEAGGVEGVITYGGKQAARGSLQSLQAHGAGRHLPGWRRSSISGSSGGSGGSSSCSSTAKDSTSAWAWHRARQGCVTRQRCHAGVHGGG